MPDVDLPEAQLQSALRAVAHEAGDAARPLPAPWVRQLGVRRRRRRVAATGAAAALAVAVVGTSAVQLTGEPEGRGSQVATQPGPSGDPSPSDATVPEPAQTVSPEAPSGGVLTTDVPAEALLEAEDLAPLGRQDLVPLQEAGVETSNPCIGGSDDAVDVGAVAFGGDADPRVSQTLITQDSAERSSRQLAGFAEEMRTCLMRPEVAPSVEEVPLEGIAQPGPEEELAVYRVPVDRPGFGADASSYVVLVRVANAVSVGTLVDSATEGDPAAVGDAEVLAQLLLERMRPVYAG